jgi:hypothetical protein
MPPQGHRTPMRTWALGLDDVRAQPFSDIELIAVQVFGWWYLPIRKTDF